MSIETLTGLLAEGDWRELIGPLVVFGIYVVATILKKAAGEKLDAAEEEDQDSVESPFLPEDVPSSESPRYKPLDEAARPAAAAQSPQQRTLPYTRERQPQPSAAEQAELERQQRLRQMRDEQIQIARRRRLAQQQAEQAAVRQRTAQPVPKAVLPTRKTPQEMLRQVQTGQPARGVERSSARPLRGEIPTTTTQSVSISKPAAAPAAELHRLLRDRNSLRKAIVLKEILEKPLALR